MSEYFPSQPVLVRNYKTGDEYSNENAFRNYVKDAYKYQYTEKYEHAKTCINYATQIINDAYEHGHHFAINYRTISRYNNLYHFYNPSESDSDMNTY